MEQPETQKADPHGLIRYLRDCYRENGSRGGIWNLYGSGVKNRVFIDDNEDLIAKDPGGDQPHIIRGEAVEKLAKRSKVYEKERELLYATGLVVGDIERSENQKVKVCAPLFTCPVEFVAENEAKVALLNFDLDRLTLNSPVIAAIGGEEFLTEVENEIDGVTSIEESMNSVRRIFEATFPDCQSDSLVTFPCLESEMSLKKYIKNRSDRFQLISCAVVAMFDKSREMRGVLNEMEAMQDRALSPPILSLLGGEDTVETEPDKPGRIPAVLSSSQKKILNSSRKNPLTVAIGPPGTGKSFTIAALAIDAISRGKSVIIASKMNHAVDVAGDKIESTIGLGDAIVRGGRKGYLKTLKQFIDDLLSGMYSVEDFSKSEINEREWKLNKLALEIQALGRELEGRGKSETKLGRLLTDRSPNFFDRWRIQSLSNRANNQALMKETTNEVYRLFDQYLEGTLESLSMSRGFYLNDELYFSRKNFVTFGKAIRARVGTRADSLFLNINWDSIFRALPVWLVNFSDVHKILPLLDGKFDLAIIDEASQCDMASALPVLQRAKRAVIAGDQKQLRHLSFLSEKRLTELAEEHGLDRTQKEQYHFRDNSLLDLACDTLAEQQRVGFLNEHFRSRPEIINFSNRQFYGGNLNVMTGNHLCPHQEQLESPIEVVHVENGKREDDGHNAVEAAALLKAVEQVKQNWDVDGRVGEPPSIGVLSPFRAQVEYLQKEVAGASGMLSWATGRHQLLIGTSHSFQGEERDMMFLSLALDDDSPGGSFRFLEKPDLFNVAVTRARNRVVLFHSFTPATLGADSLWGKYFAYSSEIESTYLDRGKEVGNQAGQKSYDRFANEVAEFLKSKEATVTIGYAVAGHVIDLLYTIDGKTFGIDLVGYPGEFTQTFPLERIMTFQRAGLKIYPLAFSEWTYRRDLCEAWLLDIAS